MMNSTYSQNLHDSGLFFALMLTIMAVLAPFIIIGNLFVVLAIYKNYNLRAPTNYILTSLAVNDMVSSVALALDCYPTVFKQKTGYPHIADLLRLPIVTSSSSTLLHIVALTVDRYIAVTKPLKYPALVTPKRVGYAIASIWILSLIFLVLRGYIDLNEVPNANPGRDSHYSLGFVTFSLVIVSILVLTLLVKVVSNLRIMQIAVKQARAIANQTINDQNNRVAPAAVERRLKAVRTTGIIVGVLVFFWFPYIVFFTIQVTPLADEASVAYLNLCFLVVIAIAAALNPFIYHHRDREFRNTFLEIFRATSNKFKC